MPIDALNAFATPAQRRLIFEEAFLFQMGVLARRQRRRRSTSRSSFRSTIASASRRARVLPFKLTNGQKQALKEIVDDLQRPQPMNRLLQGDVGAGKTIVALLAALVAMENGLQVAFMAPTEILAEQHFAEHLAAARSRRAFASRCSTGSTDAAPHGGRSSREVESGAIHLVVGTHALVQGDVRFTQLGLVGHRRAAPVWRAAAGDASRQRAGIPTCW